MASKLEIYTHHCGDNYITLVINQVISAWHDALELNYDSSSNPFANLPSIIYETEKFLGNKLESILEREYIRKYGIVKHIVSTDSKDIEVNQALLCCCSFDNSSFVGENYDERIFIGCTFNHVKFDNCRFRNTKFLLCDMRYVEINGGTLESADIWGCDMYRSYFQGVVRFSNANIEQTSLNNTYFSSGALIRRVNFANDKLLQESEMDYRNFLIIRETLRSSNDKMKNDWGDDSLRNIERAVKYRAKELELIYKSLSSTFCSNGFSNDSNWAYVRGKRSEREVELCELKDLKTDTYRNWKDKFKLVGSICANYIYDFFFGYGESLGKILLTYILVVIVFTVIYFFNCDPINFFRAFVVSLGNMVGISSEELSGKENVFLSMLNLMQTTLGILITGIFGFILGNKIRNQ